MQPVSPDQVHDAVMRAVQEDAPFGDATTSALFPDPVPASAVILAKQSLIVAGLAVAIQTFREVDAALTMTEHVPDGSEVQAGTAILTIAGDARSILRAERVALNFLQHLSGIATLTSAYCDAIRGYRAKILDTRKTLPGLRALEKWAVSLGGGTNHRFSLSDGLMIKDNHIAVAGGVRDAIRRARQGVGHLVKIEVEVDTLAQLREVMDEGVDAVLLDNMTPEQLREAVGIVAGRAITEASGRINPQTAAAIAATGIDLISVGWLTHSAPVLDIGLDFQSQS